MKQFTRTRDRPSTATVEGALTRLERVPVMAVVFGIGLAAFLAIEPTQMWLLLLLAGLVALGSDGIVRSHPAARFRRLDDTALYLFVPVLFAMGAGLFLEEAISGYWSLPVGLLMAIPFGAIVYSEYVCVDPRAVAYNNGRLILNVATYLTAFAFFAAIYEFEIGLLPAAFAVGLVSLLLAIEVLREEAMETPRTLVYGLAIGLLLAEAAWALHFLPLEGSVAAAFLLLVFYLMTGLSHSYLGERLDFRTVSEFGGIATLGLLIVIASHTLI